MSHAWIQNLLFLGLLLALAVPLGPFIAKVMEGERTFLHPVLGPVERGIYRLMGISGEEDMGWKTYAWAIAFINLLGIAAVFALQNAQAALPLNPEAMGKLPTDLALNTAVSFVTNTNWQNYGGESTMSYLTQMLGLTVQNFLSAATAMAVLVALIRGLVRRTSNGIGNAWADLVRSTLYVLLPLSLVMALLLVSQGVIQNLAAYVHTASGQVIAMGPVASQVAIKMLGTNGGGFFNANSAHPFENPNALSNLIQMLAIFVIPAALCLTFGRMVKDRRQGWAVLAAMSVIFVLALSVTTWAESKGNAGLKQLPVDQVVSVHQGGGNMEGKEVRFGSGATSLFATITTSASCGAINGWHDSFNPLGGLVPLWLMELGEVVFGGVGSGLYGMLLFALVGVFIGGLMVGRTPEYLGKKIEAFEMKMASIAILLPSAAILIGTAAAVLSTAATASISNPGPHGFTQVLYAFSSCAQNNGSAFGGLNGNIPFYNYGLALAMLVGRFGVIFPVLAVAGSLGRKKVTPEGLGTLPTHTPLFVAVLVGVVLLVGALTYLPALALGPIAEQLSLR
ncbi:potassium-transporting ATPase potassium-binding subunit [Geothrix limicola]|uniref:Potassium-transporting ATPase potassium-binding subunit n=1 Tax=Geothrix limicola TaxID=2927978 RepID=A0ABQ5QH55_9BACT|nr:potassium-transporting ATPase subunit KdpA [Geothrix limicola]GLH73505.1 potassium-transporting ATPase potassium-binding subunit [Geothrix limicola]